MKKIRWGALVAYIVLAIFAIITVFPFVYMILGGLMSFRETTTIPPTLIPKHFEWSNYAKVFAQAPFARYFFHQNHHHFPHLTLCSHFRYEAQWLTRK